MIDTVKFRIPIDKEAFKILLENSNVHVGYNYKTKNSSYVIIKTTINVGSAFRERIIRVPRQYVEGGVNFAEIEFSVPKYILGQNVEMGWRPAPAPIGYLNYSHLGTKKVMLDKEIAPLIKEMFVMLANGGYSGRDIKDWLDKDDRVKKHTQRNIPLSMVYRMLKNLFYYGEFEYPEGSDKWYKGSHEPIITKELFKDVQKKLDQYTHNKAKTKWGSKTFDFKDVFKCAYCGASVIGEEKFKLLKSGKRNRHVYYHCTKKIDTNCPEPYVNELDLVDRFINFIELLEKRNHSTIELSKEISLKMQKYKSFRDQVLEQQNIISENKPLRFHEYFKHIVINGSDDEKTEWGYNFKPNNLAFYT